MLEPVDACTLKDRGWWYGRAERENVWLFKSHVGEFRGSYTSCRTMEAGSIDPAWPTFTVPNILRLHVIRVTETEYELTFQVIIRDDCGFLFPVTQPVPRTFFGTNEVFGFYGFLIVQKQSENVYLCDLITLGDNIWRVLRQDLLKLKPEPV
jgi:hypothetical protein